MPMGVSNFHIIHHLMRHIYEIVAAITLMTAAFRHSGKMASI